MVTQIVLLRHGQTQFNADGRFQGQLDVPLNDIGRAQARAAAQALSGMGIDRIVSSDLTRAFETATALSEAIGVPVEKDERLREISVGDWEGMTRAEAAAEWPEEIAAWLDGEDMRPPNGESRTESTARVTSAVLSIAEDSGAEQTVAIVAHGAVLRGAAQSLLGLGEAGTGSLGPMPNCGYAILAPREDSWVLRFWGSAAHAAVTV